MTKGFRVRNPQGTDYIAGLKGNIEFKVLNPTGDWTQYLPKGEKQRSVYFDSYSCVTFAMLNSIETQINRMLIEGEIDEDYVKEWIVDGEVNLSDRFTSKMSGTGQWGNYFTDVANSIRHDGIVSQNNWDYPVDKYSPIFSWDEFFSEIPQNLKDKGKKFLEKFDIQYEFIQSDIPKHLKQAPLILAIAVCQPYNQLLVEYCGSEDYGHTVMLYKDGLNIFDSYMPFKKILNNYKIGYYFKILVTPKRNMYKLIKRLGDRENIYYINDLGKRVHIADYHSYEVGFGKMWNTPINEVDILSDDKFYAIPKGGSFSETQSE